MTHKREGTIAKMFVEALGRILQINKEKQKEGEKVELPSSVPCKIAFSVETWQFETKIWEGSALKSQYVSNNAIQFDDKPDKMFLCEKTLKYPRTRNISFEEMCSFWAMGFYDF